jgi:glutathione S-transferase
LILIERSVKIKSMPNESVKIEVYDYEASACGTKVRWALAEEGLAWERHRVDFMAFDQKTADYLRIHPDGLVPAARFDGEIQLGGDDIMRRIAAVTGSAKIMPVSEGCRHAIDHWLSVINSFHLPYGILLYSEIILPAHRARPIDQLESSLARIADRTTYERLAHLIVNGFDEDRLAKCRRAVSAGFEKINETLSGSDWVAGDRFSIADIALFPYVNTPMHLVSSIWYGRMPHITNWLGKMRERSAFAASVADYPYPDDLWTAVKNAPGGGGFRLV